MADYITKIRTLQGDKQYDYNSLANLPDRWKKVAEYIWDGNTEYQPLTLDYATGEMTFAETPNTSVTFPVPNIDVATKGQYSDAYSKIPAEFLKAGGTSSLALGTSGYTFSGIKSITEGGANANVDVNAFHFERGGSAPVFEGLDTKRCKVRMTIPGGNVWQSNGNFTFYAKLSNGQDTNSLHGALGNTSGGRILYEIIEQEFNIHSRLLTMDYSIKEALYKDRTNSSQGYSGLSSLATSPFMITDEDATIVSLHFNVGNGNWFPCNGTVVEVFEYVD